jgi:hypothetical protein
MSAPGTTDRRSVVWRLAAIGPATQLNVFVIEGNTEADRQTPIWGRAGGCVPGGFEVIRDRLIESGASDGTVSDFGGALSISSVTRTVSREKCCSASPDGSVPGRDQRCPLNRNHSQACG